VGAAPCVADQPAARVDAWRERTQRGALGDAWRKLSALLEQQRALQCRGGGGIWRMTGRQGCAGLGAGLRMAGAQPQARVLTYGRDARAWVECEAHRDGVACAPRLEGTCPRLAGLWLVCETTARPLVVTASW
jgi:hypothetical protein